MLRISARKPSLEKKKKVTTVTVFQLSDIEIDYPPIKFLITACLYLWSCGGNMTILYMFQFTDFSEAVTSYSLHLRRYHDKLLDSLLVEGTYEKLYSYHHLINGFAVHMSPLQVFSIFISFLLSWFKIIILAEHSNLSLC